jgi:tetratricopeptide (TPR) repeat protein
MGAQRHHLFTRTGDGVVVTSTGARLDRLAELEDERRFLLQSLRDLEREHDAGDVDDLDYHTLKDGYTVRAAAVLRDIEEGRAALPDKPPRRWGRTIVVTATVVVAAVAIGLVLAGAWGERSAGQEITGLTPGDESRILLTNARDALTQGDFELANALFGRVVESERARGRDNAEAVAYFGWTLALMSQQRPDEPESAERLDAAVLALAQSIAIEPDYADPECFLAIVEFSFREDAAAALPHVERCEELDPPGDVATIVAAFADEIRTAAG